MRMVFEGMAGSGDIHAEMLNIICGNKNRGTALDVMCCEGNPTRKLDFVRKVYVDMQYRPIPIREVDMYVISDVFTFLLHDEFIYDVVFCMDGIEHLSKAEGQRLN